VGRKQGQGQVVKQTETNLTGRNKEKENGHDPSNSPYLLFYGIVYVPFIAYRHSMDSVF